MNLVIYAAPNLDFYHYYERLKVFSHIINNNNIINNNVLINNNNNYYY